MRTCRKCYKPKEENQFGVNRMFKDKKAIYCFDCNRDHTRRLRAHARILLVTTNVKVKAILGYK